MIVVRIIKNKDTEAGRREKFQPALRIIISRAAAPDNRRYSPPATYSTFSAELPAMSGKYMSFACAGMAWYVPGSSARMMY